MKAHDIWRAGREKYNRMRAPNFELRKDLKGAKARREGGKDMTVAKQEKSPPTKERNAEA